jgi:hypothetical protein
VSAASPADPAAAVVPAAGEPRPLVTPPLPITGAPLARMEQRGDFPLRGFHLPDELPVIPPHFYAPQRRGSPR